MSCALLDEEIDDLMGDCACCAGKSSMGGRSFLIVSGEEGYS